MPSQTKILIAGVGGQGVVYLAGLLVEAALEAGKHVATSEIHGLSQRGGSVNACLTFGPHTYGFIEKSGADFLLALETLEAQRCLPYLHSESVVVIDNNRIPPYAVNAEKAIYPPPDELVNFLQKHIRQVLFIAEMPEEIDHILRNIFVLGCAMQAKGFPLECTQIKRAIRKTARKNYEIQSLEVLERGQRYADEMILKTRGQRRKRKCPS